MLTEPANESFCAVVAKVSWAVGTFAEGIWVP